MQSLEKEKLFTFSKQWLTKAHNHRLQWMLAIARRTEPGRYEY